MTNDSRGGGIQILATTICMNFSKKGKTKMKAGNKKWIEKCDNNRRYFLLFCFFPAMTNNIARKIITTKDFGVYTQIPAAQQQQQLFIYLCI
jgi:hypothetical protein